MIRLNLIQTCLLDASGELGRRTRAQLHDYLSRHPHSREEYERILAQLQLLRSLPRVELTDDETYRIATSIKQGVHRKVRELELARTAEQRRRLVYKAMAAVSGLAACIVVGLSVWVVHDQIEQHRLATIASAQQKVEDYLETDTPDNTEFAFRSSELASEIRSLHGTEDVSNQSDTALRLVEALSDIP